ncbi:hypothetical protein N9D37_01945, partial [Erythrobacter sp.]|nr:hypothetical protein [Erythrobacter sp.]
VVMDLFTDGSVVFSSRAGFYIAIDIIACVAFVLIALNANRNYPLWLAGFQVVALAAHMVRGLVDSVSPLAYAILVIGPSYFQLILMLVGLIRHIRREKKHGEYRDWRVPWSTLFGKKTIPDGLGNHL